MHFFLLPLCIKIHNFRFRQKRIKKKTLSSVSFYNWEGVRATHYHSTIFFFREMPWVVYLTNLFCFCCCSFCLIFSPRRKRIHTSTENFELEHKNFYTCIAALLCCLLLCLSRKKVRITERKTRQAEWMAIVDLEWSWLMVWIFLGWFFKVKIIKGQLRK